MEKKYFIQENGTVSQPYSLDDLRSKNILSNTLVCVKFGDWKAAKDIPELSEILEWQPSSPSESNWVPPSPQVQTPSNQQKQSSNNKAIIIVMGAILVAAFFMPWFKVFVSITACDIVFGTAGDLIETATRYVLVIIPISGILIIYGTALNDENYPVSKSLLFILPLLTLLIIGVIIVNKLGIDAGGGSSNDFGEMLKIFGIGLWLTLISSIILPFIGNSSPELSRTRNYENKSNSIPVVLTLDELKIKETEKLKQKTSIKNILLIVAILVQVSMGLYILYPWFPYLISLAANLLYLSAMLVIIPIIIWALIKLNKLLYSKL